MKGEEVVVPGVAPEQYRAGVLRQRLRKRFLKKVLEKVIHAMVDGLGSVRLFILTTCLVERIVEKPHGTGDGRNDNLAKELCTGTVPTILVLPETRERPSWLLGLSEDQPGTAPSPWAQRLS